MKLRQFHTFAPLLLLLVFLGSKSLEYHPLSHSDEDRASCEWCDFALVLQATPFEPAPDPVSLPEMPLFAEKEIAGGFIISLIPANPGSWYSCRPPPAQA